MNQSIRKVPFVDMTDQDTKRSYERISPEGQLAHYPYFYQKMIDETTNRMLVIIEEEGIRNLYLLQLEDGLLNQLTFYDQEDKFNDYSPQFTRDGKSIIYVVNNCVVSFCIDSSEMKTIYTPEKDWDTYGVPAFSSDGGFLVTMDFPVEGFLNRDNSNWDSFMKQGEIGLRSQLVRVCLKTGVKEILIDSLDYESYGLKKNQWLGHPQFKPGSNTMISYCHEGWGGTVDARIWLYDYTNKTIQCPRERSLPGEIISHEFFTHDGRDIGFIRIENNDSDRGSLRLMDSKTFVERNVMDLPRCSHFMTNSTDDYIIADADYPAEPYIHFIDLDKKKDTFLVKHNSSMKSYGNTQDAHPHPFFSPDSQQIFFVSDMEGYPAIYRCDVSDLVKIKKK